MNLDFSKLSNIKRNSDGTFNSACPICLLEGHDKVRNHLWIHPSHAFRCAKYGDSKDHNRAIRSFLIGDETGERSYEFFDYAPKLTVDKVYPEDSLNKLLIIYDYWLNRGIKEDVLKRFGGGLAAEEEKSRLSNRFVFPCRNSIGTLIGFSGRLIVENSFAPKWKIIGKKNHFIFPNADLFPQGCEEIILVEGIGCCLSLCSIGTYNTLCLFGLNISSEQIGYLITRGIKKIIIATNNEASGIGNRAAEELKIKLSHFFDEDNIRIHLPPRKDFLSSIEMGKIDEIEEWNRSL